MVWCFAHGYNFAIFAFVVTEILRLAIFFVKTYPMMKLCEISKMGADL
jgi:hypothetical protein